MATVNLYLKDSKAQKTAIRAVINDGRSFQFKFYSGISVKPKHWSKRNKRVLSADPNAAELNRHLMDFQERVLGAYLKAKREGIEVSTEYLKKEVWPQPTKVLTFWEVWTKYLESKKGEFKPHRFTKFRSLAKHLKDFEEAKRISLDLETISEVLLEDLQKFFYYDKKLNTQSTDKYIGQLRMFLNWAVKRKFTIKTSFRNFQSTKQPDALHVIITAQEMARLESLDLSDKKYLSNTRELFILSCLTGLRFSDYSRLNQQHLRKDKYGDYYLQIRQQKTSDFVEVPLTARGKEIVEQLIGGKIHAISNQKMNKYVKELCILAKVDEPCEVHTYVGREGKTEVKPKHDLITTHTGRRTFATNLLEDGIPAETVMQFTGHKDYKSFSKYINIPRSAQKDQVKRSLMKGAFMKLTG